MIQSCYLSLEGSKLHQVDLDVCFKCHSVLLSCNETLHTDFFPRLRGIRPSKRRIQSSSLAHQSEKFKIHNLFKY